MNKKILAWEGIVILAILIVLGGQYAYERVFGEKGNPKESAIAVRVQAGEIKKLNTLIVAEQVNNYGEFLKSSNHTLAARILDWATPGKISEATFFIKWDVKVLYGIRISEDRPLTWKRTKEDPGAIEILAPPLEVIESIVVLDRNRLVMTTIKGSVLVNEESRKNQFIFDMQAMSDEDAKKGLSQQRLRETAEIIIGSHVTSIVNHGVASADKVHSARVVYRT